MRPHIEYCTINERVIFGGTPENYDPKTQGPVLTAPVRSTTAGEWDGDGR